MNSGRSRLIDLLIPLLVALPAAWVLLPGGLPNTADGPVHFIRAAEMVQAWQQGLLLPRWSANLGFGYGIPLFIFAPPLPYLLTAALHAVGLPMELAFKGMWLLGLLLCSGGAYLLARHPLGILPGAVGAAAYVYAPIRLRELFIQGNAGQFIAWVFIPWACWGVIQLYRSGQKRYSLVIALALTGAALGHNVASLLLGPLLALLTLVLFIVSRDLRRTLWVGIGGLLGLGLSAWFWLPALLEGEYLQLHRIVASDFRNRFIPLVELAALSPPLDSGAINPYFPLTLGAVQVALAGLGLLGLLGLTAGRLVRRRGGAIGRPDFPDPLTLAGGLYLAGFSLFGAFMALEWSEPVWNVLPFVDLFEFPFRWHGFTLVGLSWLAALAIRSLRLLHPRAELVAGIAALGLIFGAALVHLYPQHLPLGAFRAGPADVVRFEVETGTVGTTSLGEFNPIWVDAFDRQTLVQQYLAGLPVERLNRTTLPPGSTVKAELNRIQQHRFSLNLPASATITLNLVYFPGWEARLDGQVVPLTPQSGSGLITLAVPAGTHTLDLRFRETPLRRLADTISIISWLVALGLVGFGWRKRTFGPAPAAQEASLPPATVVTVVGVLVLLTIGLRVGLPDRFRMASPPGQARPARVQQAVDFGGRIRLLGFDPSPVLVAQGQPLTVVAYWQARPGLEADYSVFLHLDGPDGQTLATVDELHPSEIPTSQWPPTLYLRNPLRLRVPADAPPIRYSLRLGLYDPHNGERLAVDAGDQTSFEVGQVWVRRSRPPVAPAGPRAQFGPAIQLRGIDYHPQEAEITLYWETAAPIPQDYSIFLHLLDAEGTLLGQVDGTPYQNRYPTTAWRVGQVIEDTRSLAGAITDLNQVRQLAIGLYDPQSGERLAARDAAGQPLPYDALLFKPN